MGGKRQKASDRLDCRAQSHRKRWWLGRDSNSAPQPPSFVNFSQPWWSAVSVYVLEDTAQEETLAAVSGEAGGGRRLGRIDLAHSQKRSSSKTFSENTFRALTGRVPWPLGRLLRRAILLRPLPTSSLPRCSRGPLLSSRPPSWDVPST